MAVTEAVVANGAVADEGASLLGYHAVAAMAQVHGLAAAGLLTEERAAAALDALAAVGADPPRLGGLDAVEGLRRALRERLGEGATAVEAGVGVRDRHATAIRLWARDAILATAALLVDLRQALTDLAGRAGDLLAPGAEPPVLLGHYLLAYVEQLYRDGNRLKEVYVRADILPLGAGDGAGVVVAVDRALVARLLGMHANTRNSLDAVGDRDFAIEHLAALALVAARAERLAGDPVLRAASGAAGASGGAGWVAHGTAPGDAALATADAWRAALADLAAAPQGHGEWLGDVEAAQARAVEATQAALRRTIRVVRGTPPTLAGAGWAGRELERFASRGATAPSLVAAAVADTHERIDGFRRWIGERRAAHATVEALRRYPAERAVTLLPHNDPPSRGRAPR
jgi:hypothetical protein